MGSMSYDLSDIARTLANLIRTGIIAEVDGDKARVQLAPNLSTTWLRWVTDRAGDARTWWSPSVGEQVIVLSPDGDLTKGKILGSIYTLDAPAPETNPLVHATHYPDGAVVRYDAEAHALTAILPDGSTATIKADLVTADAKKAVCTGDVEIKGDLVVQGSSALNNGATVKGGAGGAAVVINGDVTATGDVKAGDISLRNHKTKGIKRGDEISDGPTS
jgi:phage baseplate assembly protein V